eukprot:TRINITY_DN26807_c0_g1_i1.p2 TRINITY_DN26807_c0_g1~~TRINITY_DN26807_c0_g1_i1.p2  ORF type:complete len:249 (+),score=119.10 TRINITY_DN26807_c0_g1_i1:69-815(+)
MMSKPEKRGASVYTSSVSNECQALFDQRVAEARKKGVGKGAGENDTKLVSQGDVLYIMRGIGMNPTQDDLEELIKNMLPYDEERKEDKKRRKDRGQDKGRKEDEEGDKKVATLPPEEVPKYTIDELNRNLEKVYKNPRRCEEDIIEALKVFDLQEKDGGRIRLEDLITIMTENGDDVLSHGFGGEVQELKRLFGNGTAPDGSDADLKTWISYQEFARTMQEGKRPEPAKPPTPPPEEGAGSRKPSQAA